MVYLIEKNIAMSPSHKASSVIYIHEECVNLLLLLLFFLLYNVVLVLPYKKQLPLMDCLKHLPKYPFRVSAICQLFANLLLS